MSEGRRRKSLLATTIFFTASLVGVALQVHGQPVPYEQVEKPEVRVGDSWTYTRNRNLQNHYTYTLMVNFVGPDLLLAVTTSSRNSEAQDSIWSSEWNAKALGVGIVYKAPTGLLKFPLKVGATYDATYQVAGVRGKPDAPSVEIEVKVKVVGWEDVEVAAGKFSALKVEAIGTTRRLDNGTEGRVRHQIWWVPEVERWVKWVWDDGTPAPRLNEVDELVKFRLVEKSK